MNPMNDEENIPPAAAANEELFREPLDPNGPIGPIELSILERVENGLIYSEDEAPSQENQSRDSEAIKNKYEGPKEIIFVSGWININSVYKRYFWGFLSKIAIGNSLFDFPRFPNIGLIFRCFDFSFLI